ncbi:IS1182 family transposase [Halochromatium roseum]|uniref:IS1182 family transposase n=1 Tax=Halochromatium roseum TaxID=391920 RepID=UPI001912BDFC|nr:IS1182 family transposase [Halochromatium roseum]MBK5942027.1 IS5/IS1182 family transposase [Halochromatium roseum]
MPNFRSIDRDRPLELPLSLQDWLPAGHLARYIVEVVEALDLSPLIQAYAGRGSLPYHPAMMLSLLIYGYATGCYSSRKIELATFDSVAFRFIACNQHPDHDTLATFRKRFRVEFEAVFVQVLEVAHAHQFSRFGQVSLDGTKIHANASRHSALSYGHAEAIEAQLKGEVQELLALAEQADGRNVAEGMSIPEELQRREARLAAIAEAKRQIEARAAERFAREQAAYEAKLAARAAKAAARGRKPGGKAPKAPSPEPRAEDQINLTDAESRIMHVAGGGFEQCYNAQAVVDTASMLVMVAQVTQAGNDKEQVAPLIEGVQALPEGLNHPEDVIADNGYFSEHNVEVCEAAGIAPLIAMKRDEHHPHWSERFSEPAAVTLEATPVERMAHRLKSRVGRAAYALRKQTVEPVFGIIKSVMGFRQFLTRGLQNVQGEWTLVCLAWNLKRMAVLRLA